MQETFTKIALSATIQLHGELLADDAFAGFDGSKEQFDRLYAEVYVIVRDELWNGAKEDQVVETFHAYQEEIASGDREVDWYLYQ